MSERAAPTLPPSSRASGGYLLYLPQPREPLTEVGDLSGQGVLCQAEGQRHCERSPQTPPPVPVPRFHGAHSPDLFQMRASVQGPAQAQRPLWAQTAGLQAGERGGGRGILGNHVGAVGLDPRLSLVSGYAARPQTVSG